MKISVVLLSTLAAMALAGTALALPTDTPALIYRTRAATCTSGAPANSGATHGSVSVSELGSRVLLVSIVLSRLSPRTTYDVAVVESPTMCRADADANPIPIKLNAAGDGTALIHIGWALHATRMWVSASHDGDVLESTAVRLG